MDTSSVSNTSSIIRPVRVSLGYRGESSVAPVLTIILFGPFLLALVFPANRPRLFTNRIPEFDGSFERFVSPFRWMCRKCEYYLPIVKQRLLSILDSRV